MRSALAWSWSGLARGPVVGGCLAPRRDRQLFFSQWREWDSSCVVRGDASLGEHELDDLLVLAHQQLHGLEKLLLLSSGGSGSSGRFHWCNGRQSLIMVNRVVVSRLLAYRSSSDCHGLSESRKVCHFPQTAPN